MTPEDWERCDDPEKMLAFLRASGRASPRKLLLASAACCRHVWHLLHPEARQVVVAAEAAADRNGSDWREPYEQLLEYYARDAGLPWAAVVALLDGEPAVAARGAVALLGSASWTTADQAHAQARAEAEVGWDELSREATALQGADLSEAVAAWGEARMARHRIVVRIRRRAEKKASRRASRQLAEPLHCLFGNPFRPPAVLDPAVLAYNGAAVRRLAEAIYQDRRFEDGQVLADLLEEAGWSDPELLAHLRVPGPHCLGCHALDAVLGKS